MKKVIEIENLCKSYQTKKEKIDVLKSVSAKFELGKFYAIMGHSGSGKSTLVNILGLIDEYSRGKYMLFGENIEDLNDKELSYLRMKNIGFVFQEFYLNPTLKAYENVILPMVINHEISKSERKTKALELLGGVGLSERAEHFPKQMSGGEQQRVAIARALANDPKIILADEPTGNLDEISEQQVFNLLKEITKRGKCVIVVTHSDYIKKYADKIFYLKDGKLS